MDFTCALITGGGGGIGKAMAAHFIAQGKKVLIAGRTESNLRETSTEIGAAGYYVLDTGAVASMPDFVKRLTTEHPDLDCVVNNAGVQRPLEFLKGDAAELLAKADQEIDINIRGPLHLSVLLLPHLTQKKNALIVNVSSVLGFVPFSVINPVYNGTKAWLHSFSINLRAQLAGTGVRVVEVAPPMVGTDLHREREDPDDNKKSKNSMSLDVDEFMEEVARKLEAGDELISAGMGAGVVAEWDSTFGEKYRKMTQKK